MEGQATGAAEDSRLYVSDILNAAKKKKTYCAKCKWYRTTGLSVPSLFAGMIASILGPSEQCHHPTNIEIVEKYDDKHYRLKQSPAEKNAENACATFCEKWKFWRKA